MKHVIKGLLIASLLTSTINAKECVSIEDRIAFGTIGVLQGFAIGGPIGAFWGFGTVVFADAYGEDCKEVKTVKNETVKQLVEVPKVEEKTVINEKKTEPASENIDDKLNSISDSEKRESLDAKTVEIQSFVNFAYDKYNVTSTNKKIADLKVNDAKVIIVEGHTDEKGTEEYNIALGLKRANSVKKYLIEKNVDSKKINVVSYGESVPVSNKDDENRRVDLKITYK